MQEAGEEYQLQEQTELEEQQVEEQEVKQKDLFQVQLLVQLRLQVHHKIVAEEGEVPRENHRLQVHHNLQVEEEKMTHTRQVLDQPTTCLVMTKLEIRKLDCLILIRLCLRKWRMRFRSRKMHLSELAVMVLYFGEF